MTYMENIEALICIGIIVFTVGVMAGLGLAMATAKICELLDASKAPAARPTVTHPMGHVTPGEHTTDAEGYWNMGGLKRCDSTRCGLCKNGYCTADAVRRDSGE